MKKFSKKQILAVILSAAMALAPLTFVTPVQAKNNNGWKKAYEKVLKNRKKYDVGGLDVFDSEFNTYTYAVSDIDNDKIPELLLCRKFYDSEGYIMVFTYKNGKLYPVKYDKKKFGKTVDTYRDCLWYGNVEKGDEIFKLKSSKKRNGVILETYSEAAYDDSKRLYEKKIDDDIAYSTLQRVVIKKDKKGYYLKGTEYKGLTYINKKEFQNSKLYKDKGKAFKFYKAKDLSGIRKYNSKTNGIVK